MKKLMCALVIFITLFMFCPNDMNVYALGEGDKISVNFESLANNNTETIIYGGIVKKEEWSYVETNPLENVRDNSYKYITMRLDVTYTNKNGKKIATTYLEANFRYNTKYKEAKCLSVAHGEEIIDHSYDVVGFSRTKNSKWSRGAAYGQIKLCKGGKIINKDQYILKCNYKGYLKLVKI